MFISELLAFLLNLRSVAQITTVSLLSEVQCFPFIYSLHLYSYLHYVIHFISPPQGPYNFTVKVKRTVKSSQRCRRKVSIRQLLLLVISSFFFPTISQNWAQKTQHREQGSRLTYTDNRQPVSFFLPRYVQTGGSRQHFLCGRSSTYL